MHHFQLVALATASLFGLGLTSPLKSRQALPSYDVIIVGGGPAGLSTLSALGRVRDSALLIDSGVYRKGYRLNSFCTG